MMKKKNVFKLSLVVLFSICLIPSVNAEEMKTLGDLRRAYENLVAEKRENDNKTAEAKAEIARKEAAIRQAEVDITKAEDEHREAERQIDESNKKIKKLTKEAEKIFLYLQQLEGQNAYVEYVSGASSMTDLITRVEAVKQVTGYVHTTMKNLEKEIKRNEQLKRELEEKKKKLEKEIVRFEAIIKAQYSNLEDYDKYALNIDQKIKVAKDRYESQKSTCQKNIGKSDDSVKLSDCTNIPYNGGWLKPLNSGVVTSRVSNNRLHPTLGYVRSHNAIDIGGNSEGTPVYAAAAGIVSGVVYRSRCGGNMVYIEVNVGGVNYTTYYYHLYSINVSTGDTVSQSTKIGTVGGYTTSTSYGGYDGCTTGAHLHYGVATGHLGTSIPTSRVIVPPGFKNSVGYRFTSRMDYYRG